MMKKSKNSFVTVLIILAAMFVSFGDHIKSNLNKDVSNITSRAISVLNLGIRASKDQATLGYNQVNYYEKCRLNGWDSDLCIDALATLEKERGMATSSSASYYSEADAFAGGVQGFYDEAQVKWNLVVYVNIITLLLHVFAIFLLLDGLDFLKEVKNWVVDCNKRLFKCLKIKIRKR